MKTPNYISVALSVAVALLVGLIVWQGWTAKDRIAGMRADMGRLEARNTGLEHALEAEKRVAGINRQVGAQHASTVAKIRVEAASQARQIEKVLAEQPDWALVAVPKSVIKSLED
jgi:hypothetical protein